MDVDGESKKLLGLGQKHLVMGNVPAAVNAFQEAASLLWVLVCSVCFCWAWLRLGYCDVDYARKIGIFA